jgi:hypothetical protein
MIVTKHNLTSQFSFFKIKIFRQLMKLHPIFLFKQLHIIFSIQGDILYNNYITSIYCN